MTAVASSSKGSFPFSHGKNSLKFDKFVSEIPLFYSSPAVIESNNPTFRTTASLASYVNDPELYMGENCDAGYEHMLMNSDLCQLLDNDIDGFSKTNQNLDVDMFSSPEKRRAQKRLQMLLTHVNHSFLKDTTNNTKGKGKEKIV
ncbi:uncharacterized protein EV154DRAFT_185016 [Mucor mucedo]|uniref:Uncharacterized protein n=1 Tax=Mucor saturninus TaxID=64648 RepID=A0A8H7V3F9_9FUNG|nr:uncharacterized protein EV154DRAFT_185016 [Mucor mucedo]KAG2205790.1 hypothetical protein INT47_003973 [Mucor saturninus]KAI7892591.1 hypothetical protein EV154DRAFT_185016 [Mucor mucedo]